MEQFAIIGLSIKTDNSDPIKLNNDLQSLWGKFISENTAEQIPGKIDNKIYCVYTEYDGDYTKPYLALLGCKVNNLDIIPTGLVGKKFKSSLYNKYIAKGNILQGMIFEKWKQLWSLDIARTYIADFEVYDEKSQNPQDAEVEIFIGVKHQH